MGGRAPTQEVNDLTVVGSNLFCKSCFLGAFATRHVKHCAGPGWAREAISIDVRLWGWLEQPPAERPSKDEVGSICNLERRSEAERARAVYFESLAWRGRGRLERPIRAALVVPRRAQATPI